MAFLNKILLIGFIFLFIALAPNAQQTKLDSLIITSWNIHLLPAPIFFWSRKKKRTELIINHFKEQQENDVLLFQEVFQKNRRKQIIKGLSGIYPYHTQIVNSAKGKLFKTNSGLLTFSKTPITEVNNINYENCSGSDCMAYKGAQMLSTKFNGQLIYIINTHLNSEPPRTIALNQIKMINDSLSEYAFKKSPYVFIGGDLNINISDSLNYQQMIRLFKTNNINHLDIVKNESSIDVATSTLDYIFIYNSIESNLISKKYKYLIGPEWKKGTTKKIYNKTVGYSDHYPVQSITLIPSP
jgi:endonuclease/exonuclease/phosphatase family metal-dependent hydrolase